MLQSLLCEGMRNVPFDWGKVLAPCRERGTVTLPGKGQVKLAIPNTTILSVTV
jgi:hypothetical protein